MKPDTSWVKMNDIAPVETHGSTAKGTTQVEEDVYETPQGSSSRAVEENGATSETRRGFFGRPKPKQTYSHAHFKVYKRRWLGLAQLVLLNIVVSWDVSRQQETMFFVCTKLAFIVVNVRPGLNICSDVL